jgi:hypothetical protein
MIERERERERESHHDHVHHQYDHVSLHANEPIPEEEDLGPKKALKKQFLFLSSYRYLDL